MKIYKFRSLATEKDFERVMKIIETGEFRYSKFSELNDPMEGAFHALTKEVIDKAYAEKKSYRICSFSGKKAFSDPRMWGYYANGFRGIAIEVKCDETDAEKIKYTKEIQTINGTDKLDSIKEILTTKLNPWKHEAEFRFLIQSDRNFHKVGEIKAVYFGNPYGNAVNKKLIYEQDKVLHKYAKLKNDLIKIIKNKKYKYSTVVVKGVKVKVDK